MSWLGVWLTAHGSRGFLVGGVVVATVVLAGVGLSIATVAGGGVSAVNSGTPSAAASLSPGGSACGLPGMDGAGSTVTVAPAARWVTVGTMAAPSSTTAGPGRTQASGLRSCYPHTATGALFAVANIWAMGSDPRLYRTVLARATASGRGRVAALTHAVGPSNTGTSAQIAGFRITSYTPSTATVDLAFQLSNGMQVSFPAPVRWQNSDWKIELADDGSPVFRPALLQSLTGYVPWGGTA